MPLLKVDKFGCQLANEAIDLVLRSNRGAILCKLDFGKVLRSCEFVFFMFCIAKMGFRVRWIKWCIFTACFSVIVNRSPQGFFRSSWGLRQGDLLSPYLFVIVMEALSHQIERAINGGFHSACGVVGMITEVDTNS